MKPNFITACYALAIVTFSCSQFASNFPKAVASPVLDSPATTSETVRITAQPDKAIVEAGEPVIIHVELENAGPISRSYNESKPDLDFTVNAKSDDGKEVAPTAFARYRLELPMNIYTRTLKRGDKSDYDLTVNRLIDMTKTGIYSISVSRFIFKPSLEAESRPVTISKHLQLIPRPLSTMVVSNTIRIEVVEPTITASTTKTK